MSLVIRVKEGETTYVTNRKNEEHFIFKVYDIKNGTAKISFLDNDDLFDIQRAQRIKRIIEQRNS